MYTRTFVSAAELVRAPLTAGLVGPTDLDTALSTEAATTRAHHDDSGQQKDDLEDDLVPVEEQLFRKSRRERLILKTGKT